MRPSVPGPVYPITSAIASRGLGHVQLARLYLESGIRFFQVREKHLDAGPLLGQLLEIAELCSEAEATLIVNDRLDLALACGAQGIHLGLGDLPVPIARRLVDRPFLVGLSTHSEMEFLEAQEAPVDYVAIGPVFETATKPGARFPLGIDLVSRLMGNKRLPAVAIGGIDLDRARRLWDAGVDSVAVIADINRSPDPAERIREYLEAAGS